MNKKATKDGLEFSWEKNEEYKAETDVEKCLWEHVKEHGQTCGEYFKGQVQLYTINAQSLRDKIREWQGPEWLVNYFSEQLLNSELACDAAKVLLERVDSYTNAELIEEVTWKQVLEQNDALLSARIIWDQIVEQKDNLEAGDYFQE